MIGVLHTANNFVIVLNFTKFNTWKLIFIWIMQERLALCLVQIWSQKYATSCDFWERRFLYGVLFCEETLFELEDTFLSRFWQENMTKTYNLFGCWNQYCLQKLIFFEVFKLSLPLNWLPPAFSSHFVQATIAQDTALLRRCRPRTSDNAICAFRKVSDLFLGLSARSLPFSHIFLHNSLK